MDMGEVKTKLPREARRLQHQTFLVLCVDYLIESPRKTLKHMDHFRGEKTKAQRG